MFNDLGADLHTYLLRLSFFDLLQWLQNIDRSQLFDDWPLVEFKQAFTTLDHTRTFVRVLINVRPLKSESELRPNV